jgi:essential nuclear protein 1
MPRVPQAPQNGTQRHEPLAEEYAPSYPFKQKASHKKRKSRSDGDEEEEQIVDTKASRKILRIGQELADEDNAQRKKTLESGVLNPAFSFDNRFGGDVESEEEGATYEEWEDEDEVEEEVRVQNIAA